MYQKNRLRIIGTLMVISVFLLLGVTGSWLVKQYQEEKISLVKDLSRIYSRTQRKLLDSLISGKIMHQIGEMDQVKQKGISMNLIHTDTTIINTISGKIDTVSDTSDFKMVYTKGTDTLPVPMIEKLSFVLRSIAGGMEDSSFLIADTGLLKHRFDRALISNKYHFTSTWTNDTTNKNRLIIFSDESGPSSRSIYIDTFSSFLVRRIIPQIFFSLLLILLCSMAFILSYRTIRQQSRLARQKDGLISNISHELKTPVATVKVALEAFNHYHALDDPQKTKDYLQMATQEIDRLEQLIGSVLNSMQLEQGKIIFHKEAYTLQELLLPVIHQLNPSFETAGIVFSFDTGNTKAAIAADKVHLQGAFYNLLDNAIKYGGSQLMVSAQQTAATLVITIADNGPGIPEEYRHKVFEQFFRIPSGNRHDIKGHGLGLSYTSYVIEEHGGSIKVQRSASGGAAFIISLPVITAA